MAGVGLGGDVGANLPSWLSPASLGLVGATAAAGYGVYKLASSLSESPARALRRREFHLDPSAVLLNHGSFGSVPRCISAKQRQLHIETETHPDKWFRCTSGRMMKEAACVAGKILNADEQCIGFVTNATTGVNAVLSSFPFKDGDQVLITNLAYGAVRYTAEHICRVPGVELKTLSLQFPIQHEDDVVRQLEAALDSLPAVKLCIVEHITSPTAVVMPVERIIKLCRSRSVRILVDGAHAPGQLKIDLKKLDPDYYTGNFHKWFFAPRGCAFLYTRSDWLDEMQPVVISWGWKGSYQERFARQGTRDETPFVLLPDCLEFVENVLGGQDAIVAHNYDLVKRGAAILAKAWGTEELDVPEEMRAPCMRLVRLPLQLEGVEPSVAEGDRVNNELRERYNAQAAPCFVQGKLYCRISAQVYNDESEFHQLAKCALQYISTMKPL